MPKSVAKILGIVLMVAGVGTAIVHYMLEGKILTSWLTLGIAAVLLVVGWGLYDWGAGFSARRRGPDGQ
jgi:hypothetical protein